LIAEIEKLRADARKADMETRIEPWKFLVGGLAAGAALMGAATALVAAFARSFFTS